MRLRNTILMTALLLSGTAEAAKQCMPCPAGKTSRSGAASLDECVCRDGAMEHDGQCCAGVAKGATVKGTDTSSFMVQSGCNSSSSAFVQANDGWGWACWCRAVAHCGTVSSWVHNTNHSENTNNCNFFCASWCAAEVWSWGALSRW
ncbi:MAG: hypothetical protein LBI17_02300 [Rickettsiales bacterium]|nr:hypothetical protein [Rickettsiales bacterium]